jgi:hypothetical protein
MNRLISAGLKRGWRHGVLEGNRSWLLVGGVALTFRLLQRMAGKEEKVVYREQLRPGETLVIAHDRTVSG